MRAGSWRDATSGWYGMAVNEATPSADTADGGAPALRCRVRLAQRMAVDVSVISDMAALRAIEPEWRALAGITGSGSSGGPGGSGPTAVPASSGGGLFRGPDWLIPWWQAYHATLGAELYVVVGRSSDADASGLGAGEIVCIAQ